MLVSYDYALGESVRVPDELRARAASTSCGSLLLLAQLDRTAKRFPCVKRTSYSFAGNRRAFYEWLQRRAP